VGKNKGNKGLDDLAAVRTVVGTLRRFDDEVRDRILRWAQEKLDDLQAKSTAKKAKKSKKSKPADKKKGKKAKTKAKAKKSPAKKKTKATKKPSSR